MACSQVLLKTWHPTGLSAIPLTLYYAHNYTVPVAYSPIRFYSFIRWQVMHINQNADIHRFIYVELRLRTIFFILFYYILSQVTTVYILYPSI